ncbi:efflux RND transporter permease subunit, partial [Pseudorhodoferax sp.]|uniref:efflux RND transporter permease subunit n=1 Tax=Pseudorhodoferax sp. TaxID=1993553 RepID=UPI002DD65BB8
MKITDSCLRNPVAVLAAVAMVCLFGAVSLFDLPVQLFPDIERPQMTIQTNWRAASPPELEAEIVEPIEAVLQGLPGLEEMVSTVSAGGSTINLAFAVGSDMDAKLVEVLARMNRLPPLPRDATPPVVSAGGDGSNNSLTFFFVQLLPGTAGNIFDYRTLLEDRLVPRLSAITGVAGVTINDGAPEELSIAVDLERAAALGIRLPEIAAQAARATDVSAGMIESGRREYALRFAGRYTPQTLSELVLAWRDGRPVRLGDVADIAVRRGEQRVYAYQNGNPALTVRVLRENGANVLATLDEVKRVVAEVRERELLPIGLDIAQSFDASLFINRAIGLLTGSLLAGIALAVGGLWWFLRNARATGLIAVAIPVSLLATFIVLKLTGRNLNVISLAGLAFAVGMVMDAAVVVAENIVRLRERGLSAIDAALKGTAQVGGALVASTLTTVAVFLPVLFMRDVEGQLFADLALTISVAVGISLLVAVTVLPTAMAMGAVGNVAQGNNRRWALIADWAMRSTASRARQIGWVVALVPLPLLLAWVLLPRIDYLPPVKRAAIDVNFAFAPGMSPVRLNQEIAPVLLERMRPYMSGEKQPQLLNWYMYVWPGGGTIGARPVDPNQIGALEQVIGQEIITGLPDTRGSAREGDLFGGFGGSPRAIAIDLQHADGDALASAAEAGRQRLLEQFPGAEVRIWPGTSTGTLELRVDPDDRRLAETGWSRPDLASVVRMLGEGQWLGEHFDGDRRLPIILRGDRRHAIEELGSAPLATPSGNVLSLGELAQIRTVLAANQVRRVDRRRTVTLTMDPPANLSLGEALDTIDAVIVPALRAALPADAAVQVSGSASRLDEVVRSMGGNLLVALLVLFVLMTAMFRSLRDSAVVMASLPMAV